MPNSGWETTTLTFISTTLYAPAAHKLLVGGLLAHYQESTSPSPPQEVIFSLWK